MIPIVRNRGRCFHVQDLLQTIGRHKKSVTPDVQAVEVALALCRVASESASSPRNEWAAERATRIETQIPLRLQHLGDGQRISIPCHSLEAASVTSDDTDR